MQPSLFLKMELPNEKVLPIAKVEGTTERTKKPLERSVEERHRRLWCEEKEMHCMGQSF